MKSNYLTLFFGLLFCYQFISENISLEKTDGEIPSPVPVSPDGDIYSIEDSIFLSWSSSGKKMVYEVMISRDENFNLNRRYSSVDTVFKLGIKELERGVWYWKVRAFKNKNSYSSWSEALYFAKSEPLQIIRQSGCNGNCAGCTHPCGRRRMPEYPVDE
ncbi:MAG: hypothetical protein A2W91_00520 [Bacteroidetes bacterium GWF2_38_335]|nr:MAG: hypothetical protein A2W91_00520 [Bacteroidetes bacterium GWF2_38_335]OFY78316.1 MAG: hypothetical protein A2281_03900 [Bacteroidetes bacterium RIFOXYA12_FULL_38_20]HBS87488.1 hypothetical protein [Bacteroidales bacterium]